MKAMTVNKAMLDDDGNPIPDDEMLEFAGYIESADVDYDHSDRAAYQSELVEKSRRKK